MGKFGGSSSKDKAKKKGKGQPTGKRARAKAKLERQWGEQPKDDDDGQEKQRRGISRLLSAGRRSDDDGDGDRSSKKRVIGSGFENYDDYDGVNGRRKRRHDREENDAYDDDDDDNSSKSSNDDDEDEENGLVLDYLLGTIRHRGNRTSSDSSSSSESSDEDDSDDDDDDEEKEQRPSSSAALSASVATAKNKKNGRSINTKEKKKNDDDDGDGRDDGLDYWKERYVDRRNFSENDVERQKQIESIHKQQTTVKTLTNNDEHFVVIASGKSAVEAVEEEVAAAAAKSATTDLVSACLQRYVDILLTTTMTSTTPNTKKSRKNRNGGSDRRTINNLIAQHVVKHVQRTRTEISANAQRPLSEDGDGDDDRKQIRDRGYTRPTCLVLLPTRNTCYEFIQQIVNSVALRDSESGGNDDDDDDDLATRSITDNWDRFQEEYGPADNANSDGLDDDGDQQQQQQDAAGTAAARRDVKRRRKLVLKQKGQDWLELFGDEVNDDDDFKLGISFQRSSSSSISGSSSARKNKKAIKLFSDFCNSDVVVASPLALKVLLEDDDNERGSDFLSSIEICYVGRADVLLMQNWDHLSYVLDDALNQQPKHSHPSIDFSKVRDYLLAGQSKYWRQLIVVSSISDPAIVSAFKRHALSADGYVKIRSKTSSDSASISNVDTWPSTIRQVFQRIPCKSFANQGQDRVKYFCNYVLDEIIARQQKHTLVYIPSYFDYVSLRNALLKREENNTTDNGVEFVSVTEYSRGSEISRGRARFLQGRKSLMLYTGRAHFFHRHVIKGARHVIFLGLPEHPQFYSQHLNRLGLGLEDNNGGGSSSSSSSFSSLALFTKYEAHALERIVGSTNCSRMINNNSSGGAGGDKKNKSTFLFG